jgi:hypothetical protein
MRTTTREAGHEPPVRLALGQRPPGLGAVAIPALAARPLGYGLSIPLENGAACRLPPPRISSMSFFNSAIRSARNSRSLRSLTLSAAISSTERARQSGERRRAEFRRHGPQAEPTGRPQRFPRSTARHLSSMTASATAVEMAVTERSIESRPTRYLPTTSGTKQA